MTSIKEMLTYGVAKRQRTWGRDRAETIGASEIGQCARKTWFAKHGATPDSDYEDSWGARERGNLIENHHWEPAIRSYLTDTYGERVEFLLAGEDQETLVDGYLSATPDGLVVNRSNQVLTIAGVDLEPNDGLVLECKSIDPRVELKAEKDEHGYQTQVQIGLLRQHAQATNTYKAVITYTDASFLDDVSEFIVTFDPAIYETAKERTRRIMLSEDALSVTAEGKMAGGKECQYCPFKSQCVGVVVGAIPQDEAEVDQQTLDRFRKMVTDQRAAKDRADEAKAEADSISEQIKDLLRQTGTRRVKDGDLSISYSSVRGRVTVDVKAAEAAGVDLSAFKKEGDPSDRLTIKLA